MKKRRDREKIRSAGPAGRGGNKAKRQKIPLKDLFADREKDAIVKKDAAEVFAVPPNNGVLRAQSRSGIPALSPILFRRAAHFLVILLLAWAVRSAAEEPGRRTLHLIQDDAQDYMVTKIYTLKYVQANDINPFVSGMIKRYNINSVANCIEFGSQNQQILTVTCPVKMMPYVDEFIAKADRDIKIDGRVPGDIIRGTGITRAVYAPKYRSGQTLVNVIVNAIINEGPYGSVYGYDANSNQIYWKDNSTNTQFSYQFLSWLDRPAPQIRMVFRLYEVRESDLTDIGIDYVAWKNGPGLDLFQVAYHSFNLSSAGSMAITGMTGGLGGFLFAPQFDASFIRLLAQSGTAELSNTAELTVANSESGSYEIFFNPQQQNLVKSNNDQTTVNTGSLQAAMEQSGNPYQVYLKLTSPIVNLHSGSEIDFAMNPYKPGDYAKIPGTLCCSYSVQAGNVVERNNYGAELIDTSSVSGSVTLLLNQDTLIGSWDREQKITQKIGMPFLMDIPVLGYLFSTTTTSKETTHVYLTCYAEMLNTAVPDARVGQLLRLK